MAAASSRVIVCREPRMHAASALRSDFVCSANMRKVRKKALSFNFLREKILIHPISYSSVIAPGIAYILLNDFTENAAMELKNILREMTTQKSVHSLTLPP